SFHQQVAKRFRLVPNFFVSTPDAPEIVEKLWGFAAAAYLDNPIPTLFKERLFVFLSRFCRSATALCATAGFLSAMGPQRVTPRLNRKLLSR
ncbi:MAG: histidine kinase, partial [Pseudolabrys sp.]